MSEQTKDTLTYIGRQQYNLKSYRYILGSSRETVAFGKKLQKQHRVGETYPVTITSEGDQRLFSTRARDEAIEATWVIPSQIAEWVVDDSKAQAQDRGQREAKGLETAARKAARTILTQYHRASYDGKRAIIRAFIEELES